MTGFPGHRRAWTQTEGERCRAVLSGEGLLSAPRHTEHTVVWRPRNWTLCKITRPEDKRNEGKRFLPLTEEWEIVISKLGQGTDLHFQLQEWILRLNSRQEEMLGLDTFVFFIYWELLIERYYGSGETTWNSKAILRAQTLQASTLTKGQVHELFRVSGEVRYWSIINRATMFY